MLLQRRLGEPESLTPAVGLDQDAEALVFQKRPTVARAGRIRAARRRRRGVELLDQRRGRRMRDIVEDLRHDVVRRGAGRAQRRAEGHDVVSASAQRTR